MRPGIATAPANRLNAVRIPRIITQLALRTALLIAFVLTPVAAWPQADTPPLDTQSVLAIPLPDSDSSVGDFRRAVVGQAGADLVAESGSALEFIVTPLPLDELRTRAGEAVGSLQAAATALSSLIIEGERLVNAGALTPELEEDLSRRGRLLFELRNLLAIRATILIDAAEAKGADLAESRAYVKVVTNLELPQASTAPELSDEEQAARRLIRQVRELPPAHEQAAPWEVPVAQLIEESQPLRLDELEERVEAWLTLVQREVRKRIRMDMAIGNTEVNREKQAIAELAARQQQVVLATVERTEAVLALYAKRGGDTSLARQYITNATGQRVNLRDPAVFYAQVKAWAVSPTGGLQVAKNVGTFVFILIVVWVVSRIVGGVVRAAVKRMPGASSLLVDFLVGGSQRVVMLIGLLIAISALGINITPLAAAIGAAGLVIGLALQGTLSNFASGILILMYRPFDVGDVVNAGGVFGKVEAMTLVSTRILTFDNQVNWVPNDSIWNNVITNATALQTRRVDMIFGIGYGDDMGVAQRIIEQVVSEHPKVLAEPAPTIRVNELGDNSVNFIVRPWALTSDYWDVYWDLMRTIKERFDEAGVNIPFPQRDLHFSGPLEVVLSDTPQGARAEDSHRSASSAPHRPNTDEPVHEPGPARQDLDSEDPAEGDDGTAAG